MAYKTKALLKAALDAIKKHKLFFVEDVLAYIPCQKTAFYDHFPNETDNRKKIDAALNKNRIDIKVSMRNKWYKSDNATLQMGLMKLIGTDEEAHRLNGSNQKIDHTTKGEQIKPHKATIKLSTGTEIEI